MSKSTKILEIDLKPYQTHFLFQSDSSLTSKRIEKLLEELPEIVDDGLVPPFLQNGGISLTHTSVPIGPSFRPHNYSRELVAYTGGHDNDTTLGWWTSSGVGESTRTQEDIRAEHQFTRAYLGFQNEDVNWIFIRAVLASVANTAIVPLQDVFGLGSEARMNLPGTVSGNWSWRYKPNSLTKEIRDKLLTLTLLYDR